MPCRGIIRTACVFRSASISCPFRAVGTVWCPMTQGVALGYVITAFQAAVSPHRTARCVNDAKHVPRRTCESSTVGDVSTTYGDSSYNPPLHATVSRRLQPAWTPTLQLRPPVKPLVLTRIFPYSPTDSIVIQWAPPHLPLARTSERLCANTRQRRRRMSAPSRSRLGGIAPNRAR
jgi:hypothetical protein